jgi:hypothetical protein
LLLLVPEPLLPEPELLRVGVLGCVLVFELVLLRNTLRSVPEL